MNTIATGTLSHSVALFLLMCLVKKELLTVAFNEQ